MPGITPLTTGALERIATGEQLDKPILQVISVKKITGGECDRVRLLISDGRHLNSFAMLATQLNDMADDLTEFTIVRVDKYLTQVVNKTESSTGKRVLIILEMTIVNKGSDVGSKIGDPVSSIDVSARTSTSTSAPKIEPKKETKPIVKPTNMMNLNTSVTNGPTHPISCLSPYQNKWVIKVRVTSKSAIRTWSNAKGEGKLFSMDLVDESGEIRATAFKEQCDMYYDMIQVGHVYMISKCQLKPANKQFTTLKNDYEMTFTNDTTVVECMDADSDIPDIKYELIPISDVANLEAKTPVDTIGICKDVGELQTFTSRNTNKEFRKRDVTLVDMSNAAVSLTLWGDDAVNFEGHGQPIILVKGVRVNEFNGGKSLSMGNGSVLKINPDIPEGHKLRGWFDNGGGDNVATLVSARTGGGGFNTEWMTFKDARDRNLGTGDKPDFFQTKAVVHVVKSQNAFYKACPQADCNKKVVDEDNGHYRCERCNAVFPNFKYRLLVNMSIGDWTSNRWATCFSDVAEKLLQRSSQEIGEALENNPVEAEEYFAKVVFQPFIFKLRSKVETFGDMQRNKLTVQSAEAINAKEYNKYLINNIKELTGISKA